MKRYKVPSERLEERVVDLVARVMMGAAVILEARAEQERREMEQELALYRSMYLKMHLTQIARGETASGEDLREVYFIA